MQTQPTCPISSSPSLAAAWALSRASKQHPGDVLGFEIHLDLPSLVASSAFQYDHFWKVHFLTCATLGGFGSEKNPNSLLT